MIHFTNGWSQYEVSHLFFSSWGLLGIWEYMWDLTWRNRVILTPKFSGRLLLMWSASLEKGVSTTNLQPFPNGYDIWAGDWELVGSISCLTQTQPLREHSDHSWGELSVEPSHSQLKVRLSNTLPDSTGGAQTWKSGMEERDSQFCHSKGRLQSYKPSFLPLQNGDDHV